MGDYKLTVGDVIKDIMTEDNASVVIESVLYYVTIDKLDYQKRIFAPGYIHVNLMLSTSKKSTTDDSDGTGGSGSTATPVKFPGFSALQDKFSRQLVTLVHNNLEVAKNYFVYKMKPIQEKDATKTCFYVELFCYSMDKLMTIDKYCNAFTAKRLGEDIFKGELLKFWLNKSDNPLQGEVNVQMLAFKNQDTDKMSEVRQPYLVQYNESFYDFLARSAIRCGEMLYFEGGLLHLGMKPDLTKASTDQTSVADSVDYEEFVDHVLDVQGRHYNFIKRSSVNDNRYCDSPAELAGGHKKTEGPTTEGTKENGSVTETTVETFMEGIMTITVKTSYYCSETEKDVFLLKGEPIEVVTTTVITDNDKKELWKLTETVKYEYEKELDDNGNVKTDKNGYTQYKKKDGSFVSTSKTSKVLKTDHRFKAVYNQPEANDANFEELEKNGYTNFSNESFDYRLMLLTLLYTALNNTSLYDIISDLFWSVAQTAKDAGVAMGKKNRMNNDKNLTLDKDNNPEQTNGTTFNLFSTLKNLIDDNNLPVNKKGDVVSLLMADFYAKMRLASQTVSQLLVRLNYGAADQGLCLGDVIKVGGDFYIVIKVELDEKGNYIVEAIPPFFQEVSSDKTKITEAIPCPPLMPEIPTVRTAEAQVAFVEDNLDPNRFGRVRVRYPWQQGDGDKSPWIRMATPFATAGGGVTFRPCTGDEVLLNYEDGNIERPYIVGSLQSSYVTDPWLPLPDRVIRSKNGHSITFNDKTDGLDFLLGMSPGASFLRSVIPLYKPAISEQNMVDLTGGINITDRYGLYQINMSSDKRTVNIASPLGNISLNAFTGISISAPNGNIKIEGKNVSIAASNKLTLKSGSAVSDRYINLADEKKSLKSWGLWGIGDLLTVTGDVFNRTLGKWLDLSFFRTLLEVFMRPVDGTLKVKSNTYVLIEAGKGAAEVSAQDYKHPNREKRRAAFAFKNPEKAALLGRLENSVDLFTSKIDTLANNIKKAYEDFINATKSYKNLPSEDGNLYDKLNNKMTLENGANSIISYVIDNRDNQDIIQNIKEEEFNFTDEVFIKVEVGNPPEPSKEDTVFQYHEKKEEYKKKLQKSKLVEDRKQLVIDRARQVASNLLKLFNAVAAWKNFELTGLEKKVCYSSDNLRDKFRQLDFYDGFVDDVDSGDVSLEQSFADFETELTKLRRTMVYKLIKEVVTVKDEECKQYQEFLALDGNYANNAPDYSDEEEWKKFAESIKAPESEFALKVEGALFNTLNSYMMEPKINAWADNFGNPFGNEFKWKAPENGKILISDMPGKTMHFDSGQLVTENNAGQSNTAYPLALRKKVSGVK